MKSARPLASHFSLFSLSHLLFTKSSVYRLISLQRESFIPNDAASLRSGLCKDERGDAAKSELLLLLPTFIRTRSHTCTHTHAHTPTRGLDADSIQYTVTREDS